MRDWHNDLTNADERAFFEQIKRGTNDSDETVFNGCKRVVCKTFVETPEQRCECGTRYKLNVGAEQFDCRLLAEGAMFALKSDSGSVSRGVHNHTSSDEVAPGSRPRASTRLDSEMMRRKSFATAPGSRGPPLASC